jgi:periplasmic divalent cation tolerance protein
MSNPENELLVVLTTFANPEDAAEVANTLVGEGLCACVNLVTQVRSIYQWKGEPANAAEVLCLIKTTRARYEAVEARLRELHTYEVPEVVALPAAAVSDSYMAWVKEQVG